jgi:hypothetical protein
LEHYECFMMRYLDIKKYSVLRVNKRENHHPISRLRKVVDTMNEPVRTQSKSYAES